MININIINYYKLKINLIINKYYKVQSQNDPYFNKVCINVVKDLLDHSLQVK